MTEGAFFQDLALVMAVAGLVAALFSRMRWPKVLGYIGAGVLLNKHTWGGSLLVDSQSINTIAQLGVVFLMFSMGLSFSAKDMKKLRGVAVPSAVIDTIVMIWLGYTVGTRVFGWSLVQSAFLGVAMCDSATTLLAKVIDEAGWGSRPFAKYVLGTSLCEDIICVGAIAVATGLANGGGMSAGAFAASLGWLAVFFLALGVCFFVSFLAYRFNFSLALGAFLVGFLGASSDVRERLAVLVDPLKSMFSAMFFVSIGLLVDPAALWAHGGAILVVSLVVVLGKLFNNTFASLLSGVDVKTSVQNGFSLAQVGEFAFMVAILYAQLVDDPSNPMFPIAVGASLLTTLLNPLMIRMSDRVGDFAERALPVRFKSVHEAYRAWLAKIGASEGSPAFRKLKAEVFRLGVYAVLMIAVATMCTLLTHVNYNGVSPFFASYAHVFFFVLAHLLCLPLLPLGVSASRGLADAVCVMLCGEGTSRWQVSVQQVVRAVVSFAVLAFLFVEWAMVSVSIAPRGPTLWVGIGVIVLVGIIGWRRFVKAGSRATKRFHDALTAEERRESLARTMELAVPAGVEIALPVTSPAIGGTVVSLNIRAKTGASVVSVMRGGVVARNVGPEWEFRGGDTIVAIGNHAQIAALKDLLGVTS